MRWITLFAMLVSLSVGSRAADEAVAPAASADAATADAVGEPEPELEGVVIERAGGGFMTATMEGPRMVLRFFDEKKKAVTPDVQRAFVKFKPSGRRPQNRTLLLGSDGMSLTHGRVLRAPFVFKAFVSLIKSADGAEVDDDDESAEVVSDEKYTVDFP